jgi:hypothetical protein
MCLGHCLTLLLPLFIWYGNKLYSTFIFEDYLFKTSLTLKSRDPKIYFIPNSWHTNKHFSLSIFNAFFLLSPLGVICMCVGILPFVGITAYLLYLFQPFASFCVTGTVTK